MEYCQDFFGPYDAEPDVVDPQGPEHADVQWKADSRPRGRVGRGGAAGTSPPFTTSSIRGFGVGFRVVRTHVR